MGRISAWMVGAMLGAAGCGGGDETSCVVQQDCFSGESCVDGTCQAGTAANNGAANNGAANNGAANNGANNGAPLETGACLVDPFTATCSLPDENDSSGDYFSMRADCGEETCGIPGCSGGWDEFLPGSGTIEAQQLCAMEGRDRYNTNLIPCDNKSFVIEATLVTKQACSVDLYTFDMSIQGYNCTNRVEQDGEMRERVRCEELEDGSKRITAIVVPSNSIASARFDVQERDHENVQFDYDINIVVRE